MSTRRKRYIVRRIAFSIRPFPSSTSRHHQTLLRLALPFESAANFSDAHLEIFLAEVIQKNRRAISRGLDRGLPPLFYTL